jgi:fructose-specific phosphotransferase system IIC component
MNHPPPIVPCCILTAITTALARGWDVLRLAASFASARVISAGMDQPVIVYAVIAATAFVSSIIALIWRESDGSHEAIATASH